MAIDVTIQYFDGCPNWQIAKTDLERAVENSDLDADIHYEKIENHDRAQEVGFRGSPTILINGRDPFADPEAAIGLGCRIYRAGDRISGSPGTEALIAALRELVE